MTPAVLAAIRALLEQIEHDENLSGGVLSRQTLRRAAELYHLVLGGEYGA
jgi:hypothetical protein